MCRFWWYFEQQRAKGKIDLSEDKASEVQESSGILGLKRRSKCLAGSRVLEIQSQKSADSSGNLSKTDQREQAAGVKTERAMFKDLVVLWVWGAKIRA